MPRRRSFLEHSEKVRQLLAKLRKNEGNAKEKRIFLFISECKGFETCFDYEKYSIHTLEFMKSPLFMGNIGNLYIH